MEPQGEGFGSLPDSVVEEIVSRVPVKTLVKLTFVSKHWKTLILNPHFKSFYHKNTSKNPPSLLLLNSPYTTSTPLPRVLTTYNLSGEVIDQWNLPLIGDHIRLLPSQSKFNKLVCLTDGEGFFVCNPSARRCIRLRDSSHVGEFDGGGFAYIPSRDEYVIVKLISHETCEFLTLSISSDDKLVYGNWKQVEAYFSGVFEDQLGVFANGVFYWVIECVRVHVLSFDVEEEAFSGLYLPFERDDCSSIISLLEMKGEIYIRNFIERELIMDLWKLNNDQITWSKQYTISLSDIDWYHHSNLFPVYVNGDGEILIFTGRCLKYYIPENATFQDAGIGDFPGSPIWGKMILHTENMLLLGN